MATKSKFDRAAAFANSMAEEKTHVHDRFSTARKTLQDRPGGLAVPAAAPAPDATAVATPAHTVAPVDAGSTREFQIGKTYDIAIAMLREPRRGARVFYRAKDLDKMAKTLGEDGQEVPAKGYVEEGAIVLVDGVTRLRSAKNSGEASLRVEICEKPKNERELYLKSRRINVDRSSQTVLDDAVRWKEMLDDNLFKDQDDIGKEVGRDQTQVSRILKINNIPMTLLNRMKEHDELSGYTVATAIARLFEGEKYEEDPAAIEIMVDRMFDTILDKKLSSRQVEDLVKSKIEGPKSRVRNEARTVQYDGVKGTIRVNESAGNLVFEIKGLSSAGKVDELRKKIEDLCSAAGADA